MAKLFDGFKTEEIEVGQIVNGFTSNDSGMLSDTIEETEDTLNIVTEAFNTSVGQLGLVEGLTKSLNKTPVASKEYFYHLENTTAVMESISSNLGVKVHVPSLEDFKNQYGKTPSHQIVLESLSDHIRRIWDKIKELFRAFLKKVTMFLRRLVGAELDLETYDKYLPEMITRIRSKKLTITDNKAELYSRLPRLLADQGIDRVTSDFIINKGRLKMDNMSRFINETLIKNSSGVMIAGLRDLNNDLDRLVSVATGNQVSVALISEEIKKIASNVNDIMLALFPYTLSSTNGLPDEVYDDVMSNLDRDEVDNTAIYSMVNGKDNHEALPSNFNAYVVAVGQSKYIVSSATDVNKAVSDILYPISNAQNLTDMYDFYKDFCRAVKIQPLIKTVETIEDLLDRTSRIMRDKHSVILQKSEQAKVASTVPNLLDGNASKSEINDKVDEVVKEMKRIGNTASDRDKAKLKEIIRTTFFDPSYPDGSWEFHVNEIDNMCKTMLLMDGEEHNVIDDVNKAIQDVITPMVGSNASSVSAEDMIAINQLLKNNQAAMTSFFTNLQILLNISMTKLVGVNTELKLELAKYIYNSGKLYK